MDLCLEERDGLYRVCPHSYLSLCGVGLLSLSLARVQCSLSSVEEVCVLWLGNVLPALYDTLSSFGATLTTGLHIFCSEVKSGWGLSWMKS